MRFISTKDPGFERDLKAAVFSPLPPDGGLFLPEHIPSFDSDFFQSIFDLSYHQLASLVASALLSDSLNKEDLNQIIRESLNFPLRMRKLSDQLHVAELFHGPSLAFKDFGARFMARLVSYFMMENDPTIYILVATSGDTGGAVASGFYGVYNIEVVVLYPEKGVSDIQERQMTTLGKNVHAIKVNGSFDDCQKIVKTAFLDPSLNSKFSLSSANSINIARLLPQIIYYFESYRQFGIANNDIVISVPSGNFGNLTAGLIAKRMGLPIKKFIASTNANDTVPRFLETGKYLVKPTISTLSNAMDVSDPSNFQRIQNLYGFTWNDMLKDISSYSFSDEETLSGIQLLFEKYNYIADPHTAIAYLGLEKYRNGSFDNTSIFLSTAHPVKFKEIVESQISAEVEIPGRLKEMLSKTPQVDLLNNDYDSFKSWMIRRFT